MVFDRIMKFGVSDKKKIRRNEGKNNDYPICIIGGRGTGKTEKLIELAAKDFSYIVVRNKMIARSVAKRAREMGVDIPFPLTYDEFIKGKFYGRGIRGFMIDDVDALLWYLARGVKVKALSLDASSVKLLYETFDC